MSKQEYSTIGNYSHLNSKDMWFGSTIPEETTFTTFETNKLDKGELKPMVVSGTTIPCLLKCYDELIVNAIDHVASCRKKGWKNVTKITVTMDPKSKEFKIMNNGEGITCSNWPDEPFKHLPVPYVLFTQLLQGSNAFKEKECVKGGVNGVGTKGVIAKSLYSTLRVYNAVEGLYYTHTHRHCGQELGEPSITKVTKSNAESLGINGMKNSFTEFIFRPQIGPLEIKAKGIEGFPRDTDMIIVYQWLIRRLVYAAVYVNEFTDLFKLPQVHITFNDWDLSHVTLSTVAESFSSTDIYETYIRPSKNEVNGCKLYPMRLIICPKSDGSETIIANTNGTVNSRGDHIDPIVKDIIGGVTTLLTDKIDDNFLNITPEFITRHIQIFITAIMPGVKFDSQSKVSAKVDGEFLNCYKLTAADIKNITSVISGRIMSRISVGAKKKINANVKQFTSDKYTPCSSKSGNILIICEGDSALKSVKFAVANNNNVTPVSKFGFMTLSGGLMNARQCVALEYYNEKTDTTERLMSKRFNKNVFINTLQNALGTRIGQPADRKAMKYSKIICCVDQDHDGKGKLFGLVVNTIHFLWPELLDGTFLYKLDTPIRRAYKGQKLIAEFYSDRDYEMWIDQNDPKKYSIKYYKGLATHTKQEMKKVFSNINSHIRGYRAEKSCNLWINNYYAFDSTPRKVELRRPIEAANVYFDKTRDLQIVKVSDYLRSDVFAYNKDDIERKLYHAVDGQNNSGRKILNGIIRKMRHDREVKVAELGGSITASQNYHHGEMCLERTIKGKAFLAVGGKQLPILLPFGQFGSRLCGGSGAGSARYIFVKHNRALTSLLFPDEDYDLLKFTEEDGKKYEPDYFVPIVPLSVLESESMPTHGWNFTIYGRDVFDVIDLVKCMIYQPDYVPWIEPRMNRRGHTGRFVYDHGVECTYGDYEIEEDGSAIIITELPYRIWNEKYVDKLEARLQILDVSHLVKIETPVVNDDETFRMTILLYDGFWDVFTEDMKSEEKVTYVWPEESSSKTKKTTKSKTKSAKSSKTKTDNKRKTVKMKKKNKDIPVEVGTDGLVDEEELELEIKRPTNKIWIEDILKLTKTHKSNINMIGINHEVIEFKNYIGPIKYWFIERRRLYIERTERELILRRLRLSMDEDIMTYLNAKLQLTGRTRDYMNNELAKLGLYTYNKQLLMSPGTVPTYQLEELCRGTEEVGDITYDYALDISDSKKTKKRLSDLRDSIIAQKKYLHDYELKITLGAFSGASIWIDELNALKKLLEVEYPRNWGADVAITE